MRNGGNLKPKHDASLAGEVRCLLAIEGVEPDEADCIVLAEIADELDLSIDEVMRLTAAESPARPAS